MKKAFNIVANVCTIVLMSIMLIGTFVLLGTLSGIDVEGAGVVVVITVLLMIFCIGTIIVSAFTLAKANDGKARGLQIAVTVLVGIVAILEFIGSGYVYGILCLIPIGFEIASICVKVSPATAQTQETGTSNVSPKEPTVDEKIAELKHLKEINAITDEQYEVAINAIIKDVK